MVWKPVGEEVRRVREGVERMDILCQIESVDGALPREVTAALERLFSWFGCYAVCRRYVLCDRPLTADCRRRGRLYYCKIEEPWRFSEAPLPGAYCRRLSNGWLCVAKSADYALMLFDAGMCEAALAAMPGRRAEAGGWVLYVAENPVYECDVSVSVFRVPQACRPAARCGRLWKISKKSTIAYEVAGAGRAYVVWQRPADEVLRDIYSKPPA